MHVFCLRQDVFHGDTLIMMKFPIIFKPNVHSFYFLPILSGIFVGTTYVPFPPWALLFCYIPLCFALFREDFSKKPTNETLKTVLKKSFWQSWITQFTLSIIGFYWVSYVAYEFGHLPWPAALVALLLFAIFIHLYIPFTAVLAKYLQVKFKLGFVSSCLAFFSILSLSEMFWPSLFPWNLGYTLYWAKLPQAQLAEWVGFLGLSFFIYMAQAFVAWIAYDKLVLQQFLKIHKVGIACFVTLLIATSVMGLQLKKKWANPDGSLSVSIVQANIGNDEKLNAEQGKGSSQQQISDAFFNLTRQSLQKTPNPDLIVWPESAFPDFLDPEYRNRTYSKQIYNFIREIKKHLLTGAYSADPPSNPKRQQYNALFLLEAGKDVLLPAYHKTHLLMFGEYFPLADKYEWLAKINPAGSGFGRGHGPTILPLNLTEPSPKVVNIGAQICYESLDPHFSADLSHKGAHVLVNLTNDSWFGPYSEPYQHMIMTLARGVEMRRPVIRSTNTGISTVSLADGTILEQSPVGQVWFSNFNVKYFLNPSQTVYSRFSRWLWILPTIVIAFVILRRKKHSKEN